jgi:hypothetical protein
MDSGGLSTLDVSTLGYDRLSTPRPPARTPGGRRIGLRDQDGSGIVSAMEIIRVLGRG